MAGESLPGMISSRLPTGSMTPTSFSSSSAGVGGSAIQAFNNSLGVAMPGSPLSLASVLSATSAAASGVGAFNTTRALAEGDNAAENGNPDAPGNEDANGDPQVNRGDGEDGGDGSSGDQEDPDDIDGGDGNGLGGRLSQHSLLEIDWDQYVDPGDPIYQESDAELKELVEYIEKNNIVKPMIAALGQHQQFLINQMRKNQAEEQARVDKVIKGGKKKR